MLLALAAHAFFAAALLYRAEDPIPQDTIIDVVLAPPWPPSASPEARAPEQAIAPASGAASKPQAALPRPSGSPAPRVDWRVRSPGGDSGEDLRRSLRAGIGCRSADLLALTAEERAACDDKLAEGARDAPAYAVVSPRLKKQFDGVFECPKDDVWCEYRVGKAPYPGLFAPRKKKDPAWD